MQLLTTTLLFTIIHDDSTSENRVNGSFSIITFLVWLSTEAVAFFTPRPSLFSLLALQYCLIYWETLSALLFKLRNYGFDQLVLSRLLTPSSRRESLGSGEPVLPWRTFAAGYTMDAWERWRIVCLAALSVEDIEDIYLFGTMITGLLLIGLGFALGYRRIQKTGNSCPKPHKAARHDWSSGKSGQHWDWDY